MTCTPGYWVVLHTLRIQRGYSQTHLATSWRVSILWCVSVWAGSTGRLSVKNLHICPLPHNQHESKDQEEEGTDEAKRVPGRQ